MSYQAPAEEIVLYRQGRQLLSEAKTVVSQISNEFSRLGRILDRLDKANGDILAEQIGEEELTYLQSKYKANEWLILVSTFLSDWQTTKLQLEALTESAEVSTLLQSMIVNTTQPVEPEPIP